MRTTEHHPAKVKLLGVKLTLMLKKLAHEKRRAKKTPLEAPF